MNKVAKILLVNEDNKYLVLTRNNHPKFGNDVDIPGGTIENQEDIKEALEREVLEEIGITLNDDIKLIYTGSSYSKQHTQYNLYVGKVDSNIKINLSWEHSSYDWLSLNDFKERLKKSLDTYMLMVKDELNKSKNNIL